MSDSLEVTTMETIAARLWFVFGGRGHWLDATEEERQQYRQIAVDIIDTAEPVWRSRVKEERAKAGQVAQTPKPGLI